MSDLNTRLLTAHAENDRPALVALYSEAADAAPDTDTACFYLTHAYIYALELDHPSTQTLAKRLVKHGRL